MGSYFCLLLTLCLWYAIMDLSLRNEKGFNMTRNKYKMLTENDIKVIQSDPEGLADYVVCNKVKSAKKTMIIFALAFAVAAFFAGWFTGIMTNKLPENNIQITVDSNSADSEGK